MTAEQILIALGQIDETLPEICVKPVQKKAFPMKTVGTLAACIAAVILSTIAITRHSARPPVTSDTTAQNVAVTENVSGTFAAAGEETGTATFPAIEGETADPAQTRPPEQTAAAFDTTTLCALPRAAQQTQNTRAQTTQSSSKKTVPAANTTAAEQSSLAAAEPGTHAATAVHPATTGASSARDTAPITTQYPEVTYQGRRYTSRAGTDLRGRTGQRLGSVTLQGFDGAHTVTAELLTITGISPDAAVAVRFPDGSCYAYVSPEYRPATLGKLTDDLDLRSNLTVGKVRGGGYEAANSPAPSSETFWALFDRSAPLDTSEVRHTESVVIDVTLPLLGYPNGSIGVTADGYLIVPLLESEKAYYIGKDRAQAFLQTIGGSPDGIRLSESKTGKDTEGGIDVILQTTKQY